ncbi:MAG: uL15 family ribosomal protein, partial [Candidatus Competibacter sp.]
ALVVFRIATHIPVPGIDPHAMAQLFDQQRGTILDMFNMFSGGALQRRLPKRGFHSMTAKDTAEIRLSALAKLEADIIDLAALKAANLAPIFAKQAKVILSGKLERAVKLRGLALTKGAREALLAAGGTILE